MNRSEFLNEEGLSDRAIKLLNEILGPIGNQKISIACCKKKNEIRQTASQVAEKSG